MTTDDETPTIFVVTMHDVDNDGVQAWTFSSFANAQEHWHRLVADHLFGDDTAEVDEEPIIDDEAWLAYNEFSVIQIHVTELDSLESFVDA